MTPATVDFHFNPGTPRMRGSCRSGPTTAGCTSRTSGSPWGSRGGEDGPAAEAALEEAARALGYIVGKRAAAPDGAMRAVQSLVGGPRCTGTPLRWAMPARVSRSAGSEEVSRLTLAPPARLARRQPPP